MKFVYYGVNTFNIKKFEKEINSKKIDGLVGKIIEGRINKFKKFFVFTLKEDSKVLNIDTLEQLNKLSDNYDSLSLEYDAVVFSSDLNDSRKGTVIVFNLTKVVSRENNKLLILWIILLSFGVVFLSLIVTKTINITGLTLISKTTWDVHYDNLNVSKGSVNAYKEAVIKTGDTTITYEVPLLVPGDYYEFTVDVVNKGSIPAKVSATPTLGGVTKANEQYLKYTATYADGSAIKVNDVLDVDEKATYKVRIEFKKITELEELPTKNITMDLTFAVNYVQK